MGAKTFKNISFGKLFFLTVLFLLVRTPSLFEGFWHGDENIYFAVANALNKGGVLYVDAWDHKPPFLYLIYALSYFLFGAELWPLKLLNSLLYGLLIIVWYQIASGFYKIRFSTSLFFSLILIISSLFFELNTFNGENLYTPLVWIGIYFFLLNVNDYSELHRLNIKYSFMAGIFFSIAAFTKIHALAEILGLYGVFWIGKAACFNAKRHNRSLKYLFSKTTFTNFLLPFYILLLPWAILIAVYYLRGEEYSLYHAIIGFSSDYISPNSQLQIAGYTIPFLSGLQFRTFLLAGYFISLTLLFWYKKLSWQTYLLIFWLGLTAYTCLISQRVYPHYLIQFWPVCLLALAWLWDFLQKKEIQFGLRLTGAVFLICFIFSFFFSFYQGRVLFGYIRPTWYLKFWTSFYNHEDFNHWKKGFNPYLIATQKDLVKIIHNHTSVGDQIHVAGNRPDLYFLSNRRNATKYLVEMHYSKKYLPILFEALKNKKPPFIAFDLNSKYRTQWQRFLNSNYQKVNLYQNYYEIWIKPHSNNK